MTIPFKKLKAEWMEDPAFRAEYDRLKPEFERLRASIRIKAEATGRAQG